MIPYRILKHIEAFEVIKSWRAVNLAKAIKNKELNKRDISKYWCGLIFANLCAMITRQINNIPHTFKGWYGNLVHIPGISCGLIFLAEVLIFCYGKQHFVEIISRKTFCFVIINYWDNKHNCNLWEQHKST